MTATHHTEAQGHSHLVDGVQRPLVASQVPLVPRHWGLRVGIALAAVALVVVSFAYGSNDDAARGVSVTSSAPAR